MGYQGAESDPEKLVLTEHLLAAVLAEAKTCCSGQPVMLVGDLNADPSVIPSLAKNMSEGAWTDVEKAFATGRGVAPALTCQFQLDEPRGTLLWLAPLHWQPPLHVASYQIAGSPLPHFCRPHRLLYLSTVEMARVYSPIWPACWVQCPERSRRSSSETVRNIWDVHIQELSFVPGEVGNGCVRHATLMMWTPRGISSARRLKRVLFALTTLQAAS